MKISVTETIVYYDGDVLLWGEVNDERWLVLHIEHNRYLCVSTEGVNLAAVSLGALFSTAKFTIDVTDGWITELRPLGDVPNGWIPGYGAYLRDYLE